MRKILYGGTNFLNHSRSRAQRKEQNEVGMIRIRTNKERTI